MPHIHTKPGEHDFTVSAYIILVADDEPKVLFHWHKKQHIYMQFGGHVELDENPWQAITHEIKEESGYDIQQLLLLQPPGVIKKVTDAVVHPYPVSFLTHHFKDLDHYHTDTAFAFVTLEKPNHLTGKDESTNIRAFTAKELEIAQKNVVLEDCKEVALHILGNYLKNWERIDTARINSH